MIEPWPRERGLYEQEHWTAQIIQANGILGDELPLDDVPGRINNRDAESPWGATVTVHGHVPELASGQTVRLTYRFDDVEYSLPPFAPQGVSPLLDVGRWYDLSMIDQTSDYAADGIDFPLVLDAGRVIMSEAAEVMTASRPGLRFTLPNLDLTLRNLLDFSIGTDPLLIVNKLMEAAGCTKLFPVLDGTVAASEWVDPRNRPVDMLFGPENAGYLPDVRMESDFLGTPNVAHYEARGSSSSDTLIGRWRDEDPASPWSISRRKKRIYAKRGSGEAANQMIADQQAMRIGLDHPRRGRTATIRGAFQPIHRGQVLQTEHPDFPELSAKWEVLNSNTTTALGSPTSWLVKEVPE